jgi:hypothetical protein
MVRGAGKGAVMKEKALKKWKITAPEPKEHWASTYFKKNPFRCVTAGLTGFGLIIIFAYHFHIEYAPSFDINSLASTVFLAAFVGLCFLAMCSVCVFSPVYFIGVYAFDNKQANAGVDHRLAIAFVLSGIAFLAFFSMIFIIRTQTTAQALFGSRRIVSAVLDYFLGPQSCVFSVQCRLHAKNR